MKLKFIRTARFVPLFLFMLFSGICWAEESGGFDSKTFSDWASYFSAGTNVNFMATMGDMRDYSRSRMQYDFFVERNFDMKFSKALDFFSMFKISYGQMFTHRNEITKFDSVDLGFEAGLMYSVPVSRFSFDLTASLGCGLSVIRFEADNLYLKRMEDSYTDFFVAGTFGAEKKILETKAGVLKARVGVPWKVFRENGHAYGLLGAGAGISWGLSPLRNRSGGPE